MSEVVAAVRERAARTPADRERLVDLLRAVAICLVVLGHWLAISVTYQDGRLSGRNALNDLPWAQPVTWLFQVMPVFFVVGGYANSASLRSYHATRGGSTDWLLTRTDRLLRPVTALFVAVPAAALVARLAGVPADLVGTATWLASIPLWFMLAYLAMVVLTPWMYALHRRAGLWVPGALLAWVALADLLRMGLDLPYVGESTYLIGWLAVYQVGMCWRAGLLPTRRVALLAWTIGSAATLVLLTTLGPYEVRMVGGNTNPPSLGLLALAATQVGLVLLIRPTAARWLARPGPWTVVVAVNSVVLTVFVWHMTAAAVAGAIVYPTGLMAQPPVDSAAWLWWRVPWLAATLVVLLGLVALFGRIELRRPTLAPMPPGRARTALIGFGSAAVLGGLMGVALAGRAYHGPGGLPPAAVVAYLAGAAALRAARTSRRRTNCPGTS
ncbi:MAG TPA: acyltransferase [Jiangellaceae bacterium]